MFALTQELILELIPGNFIKTVFQDHIFYQMITHLKQAFFIFPNLLHIMLHQIYIQHSQIYHALRELNLIFFLLQQSTTSQHTKGSFSDVNRLQYNC